MIPVLMLLPDYLDATEDDRSKLRRALTGIAPFFALAALYVAWIWLTRVDKPGYNDIRFSFSSHWPLVIAKSFWRMIFPWGLLAGAILVWFCRAAVSQKIVRRKIALAAALWMIVGILPYSFLTYMTQLPSRSTYLGGAGLAMLVGAAAARLYEEKRRTLLVIFSLIVLTANVEILWVKKMAQMRERVEPSELLKQAAAQANGPRDHQVHAAAADHLPGCRRTSGRRDCRSAGTPGNALLRYSISEPRGRDCAHRSAHGGRKAWSVLLNVSFRGTAEYLSALFPDQMGNIFLVFLAEEIEQFRVGLQVLMQRSGPTARYKLWNRPP